MFSLWGGNDQLLDETELSVKTTVGACDASPEEFPEQKAGYVKRTDAPMTGKFVVYYTL